MIEVRNGRLGKSVYATQALKPRQVILRGRGTRVPYRTRHSFQVDHDMHVVVPTAIQLINHSCEPNCGLWIPRGTEVLEVHALEPLEPGQELSLDYASFEQEIRFMPGACLCGAAGCRGRITGYAELPFELRARYGPYVAEYLREQEAVAPCAS